jgi:hypothetical protein
VPKPEDTPVEVLRSSSPAAPPPPPETGGEIERV